MISDEQRMQFSGDYSHLQYGYIKEQGVSWRDLNYDSMLSRVKEGYSLNNLSALDLSSLMDKGAIIPSKIIGVGASQLKSGTMYSEINVGRASDNAFLRLDGTNNRFLLHDGSNPRVVIGFVP